MNKRKNIYLKQKKTNELEEENKNRWNNLKDKI